MKAVSKALGEKCSFENIEVILERYGLEIGGIPPFGNLLNLETIYDPLIERSGRSAFNCGLLTESIIMKSSDLIALVKPKILSIAKM